MWGDPESGQGLPLGPGVFPEQGAEQTGKQSQAAAFLFSSVESPGRCGGGVTWARGGCQGTPPSPCSKEEREWGERPQPVPAVTAAVPATAPPAPPRTMVTSSRWRKGGVLRRRSHTSSTAAPPTSTQTKRQMTTTSPGLGLAGGCAAGEDRHRYPPGTAEPRAQPRSSAAALGVRGGSRPAPPTVTVPPLTDPAPTGTRPGTPTLPGQGPATQRLGEKGRALNPKGGGAARGVGGGLWALHPRAPLPQTGGVEWGA